MSLSESGAELGQKPDTLQARVGAPFRVREGALQAAAPVPKVPGALQALRRCLLSPRR